MIPDLYKIDPYGEMLRATIAEKNIQIRELESRLAKAQELMKEFPCWGLLDEDGLCIDPDQCAECEQENGYGSPCWTGKMKKALGDE